MLKTLISKGFARIGGGRNPFTELILALQPSSKKSAFTLTELVVTMIVITLVVTITLPLTKKKMEKVDYFSYYMGYETVKSITTEVLDKVLNNTNDNGCSLELNGTCYQAPFNPPAYTWNNCDYYWSSTDPEDIATMNEFGVGCLHPNYGTQDYLVGALQACGGVDKFPTMAQIAEIANYLYNTDDVSTNNQVNTPWDSEKIAALGISFNEYGGFLVWGSDYPNFRFFNSDCTGTDTSYVASRADPSIYAFCIGENSDTKTPPASLLEAMSALFNNGMSTTVTTTTVASVQSAATSRDFSTLAPHLTLTNGLRIYIGSDYAEIDDLNDSTNENDRVGFILYVDVNGKSGKSLLFEDIFPFYLVKSGKVIPAYNPAIATGPISDAYLGVNVIYDSFSEDQRTVKLLLKDANFKKAACVTGYVTASTYCDGEVQYDICKDMAHDCRMIIKKPIKIF
ncbi:hypothetical protein IJZ97_05335 [bacterium]|nr:hypothetical protein [bacterium]